ncbi:MAG TPA: lytic transglycosylase domain-containing protein [Gemmatimonadaceae bacterium]|jgi:membrane-bound lytic murein transglycosylase D|nr:lytic transglycosylase domain-containing protein [Gemmatimonadaceae bacterium]
MRIKTTWKRALTGLGMAAVAVIYTVPRARSNSDPVSIAVARMVPVTVTQPLDTASTGGWDLANIDNPRVDSWVRRFQQSAPMRRTLSIWLDRMTKYETMISKKLDEREMPQDLIFLAMIESGFNPKAKSPAAAGGLWQFIGETGRRYGLTISRKVDERNQPAKATDAALSYLSDLHDRFGSWYLAAAAYNTGENRVGRIMRETTGSERGTDQDYYAIAHRLPKETRDYVPKMIAAARIAKDPEAYGFDN